MKITAVIPAKGNSERIKGKNRKLLGDKPLVAWTIEFANLLYKEKLIDKIILSTNDKEIEQIGKLYGKKDITILKRDKSLCKDDVTNYDVVRKIAANLTNYDYILLLQPTSPFRKTETVKKAISENISEIDMENKSWWLMNSFYINKGLNWEYMDCHYYAFKSHELPD